MLGVGLAAAGAQSFQGITCDDVRALSSEQRSYWSKQLNLSVPQRHLIYVTCYHHMRGGRHDLGERVVIK